MPSPLRARVTPLIMATFAVLALSVAGQVIGAEHRAVRTSALAATAFVAAMLRLGWMLNRPWWQCPASTELGPSLSDAQPLTSALNARLLALGYAWGGASLLAVYILSSLRWQHGWQYGCGMLAIAALIYAGSRGLSARWSPSLERGLTIVVLVHGWAATGGLAWLILTGKIWSSKGDWAANIVFIAGALSLVGLSAMALRTSRLLAQYACQTRPA